MGLSAILEAIALAGADQIKEIDKRAADEVVDLLARSTAQAQQMKEDALAREVQPAYRERARILHRARLESLRITGNVREALIDETLERARGHLSAIRAGPLYPEVLYDLVQETLAGLEETLEEFHCAQLAADRRDQVLLQNIANDLHLDLTVTYDLRCWGGLVATSCDGRVVIINTLEARFDRAVPFLRRFLAATFEQLRSENSLSPRAEKAMVFG